MLTVVAAIIESEGKLLVCQRRRGSKFELQWEFPGGKTQANESLEQALERELREELGVMAQVGREVYRTIHKYDEMPEGPKVIELVFFAARVAPAEVRNLEFERIEWREPAALRDLNFLAGDRELVRKLAGDAIRIVRD